MKPIYYIAFIILIVGVVGFFIFGNSTGATGNSVDNGQKDSGSVQKVVLSMQNRNYYPNTITVKANQPVRIYLDQSVVGCYRSFTIRQLGIAKYLKTPDDYIEFTPSKPGTYGFACSMGMGTGTLIVK